MKTKDWFVDWFNTSWYHRLYRKRNDAEAQQFIDNLLTYLDATPKSSFMDLACGKGRHAIYLSEKGYRVVGLDLSEESIRIANESQTERLSFAVHDMRKAYTAESFDFVLNLFTSFGYFETDQEHVDVLLNMKQALKNDESLLVIDFLNASKVIKDLRPNEVVDDGDTQFVISRKVELGFVKKDITVIEDSKKHHFSEKVRLYHLADFERLFAKAGLEIVQVFGDYALHAHTDESPRLIIIGQLRQ